MIRQEGEAVRFGDDNSCSIGNVNYLSVGKDRNWRLVLPYHFTNTKIQSVVMLPQTALVK